MEGGTKMSNYITISTDVHNGILEGYISNDDFYEIEEIFEKARKRYEDRK